MKELSIQEKDGNFKTYTELINRLKDVNDAVKKQNYGIAMDILCKPYPEYQITASIELKESEDERIRQELISYFKLWHKHLCVRDTPVRKVIAWLEKQGEQKSVFEMITPEESLGIDSDTYNKIVDECIYGEQDSTDKVEPKFKVGDEIKTANEEPLTITKIDEKGYWSEDLFICDFDGECLWELVAQKLAWSEEDERNLQDIDSVLFYDKCISENTCMRLRNWLKSLKDRYIWKPSEEQMKQLGWIAKQNKDNMIGKELMSLYNDLKKLKE